MHAYFTKVFQIGFVPGSVVLRATGGAQASLKPSTGVAVGLAIALSLLLFGAPAFAAPLVAGLAGVARPDAPIELVQRRGGARFRAGRVATVRPGFRPGRPGFQPIRPVRPIVVTRGWRRPGGYWWRPGGAIAAGAAIGLVGAAAAASWAGSPPAPGYCWYYTDPSRRQGFWDVCP